MKWIGCVFTSGSFYCPFKGTKIKFIISADFYAEWSISHDIFIFLQYTKG